MNEYTRAIEALRMSCLTADAVEADQVVVLARQLRLVVDEIDRLQHQQCHACGALRIGIT